MSSAPSGTSFLRFGDKVTRILEDVSWQLKVAGSLPSDPSVLRAIVAENEGGPGVSPIVCSALTAQAAAEAQFIAGGMRDAVIVRDATKATIPELTSDVLRSLRLSGPSSNMERLADSVSEMRKLISLRMEVGDAAKQADERSLRIQDRIERAEHKVAVMKEALAAARVSRLREDADVADSIARLKVELGEVKAKGADNSTALRAFTEQQLGNLDAAHGGKDVELLSELAKIQSEFAKLAELNEAAASNLRKKRNNIRSEYSRLLVEYDSKMMDVADKTARVKEAIATESKQADILRAHFALVDLNSRAAAEEAEANRRFKQLERVAIDGRRNPATRKIQRWYRSILTVRYAEKKKTTKAVKGKPKKK